MPLLKLWFWLRHDTGMGKPMIMWSQVCSGTGTGSRLPYPGKTVPFSTGLQVSGYKNSSQVRNHMIHLKLMLDDNHHHPPLLANTMGGVPWFVWLWTAATSPPPPHLARNRELGVVLCLFRSPHPPRHHYHPSRSHTRGGGGYLFFSLTTTATTPSRLQT